MTRPDRERLRAWDRAVKAAESCQLVMTTGGVWTPAMTLPEHRPFWRTMADCQLAGFATPMEVARGGRA